MYSLLTKSQDTNDPDYTNDFTCCYGRHVKKVASNIAIVHIVLAVFLFLTHLISREDYIFLSFPISTLVILAGFVVIYADRKAKAWAYIPFLVVQALMIFGFLVAILFILAYGITVPQWLIESANKGMSLNRDQTHVACLLVMVIAIIVEALEIYLWTIVYRAYIYLCFLDGPSLV